MFCIKRWGVLEAKKRTMKSGANHDFTHASHINDFARFRGIHHRPACGLRQEAGRWFIAAHSRGSTVTRSACYLADVDVGQDTACLNCPQPRSLGAAPDDKPLRKGRAAPRIAWTGSNEVSGQVEFSSLKKNKTCVKDLWYIKPFSDLQFCFFGHLPLKMHTFEGIFSDPSNLFWLCADPSENTQFRRLLGHGFLSVFAFSRALFQKPLSTERSIKFCERSWQFSNPQRIPDLCLPPLFLVSKSRSDSPKVVAKSIFPSGKESGHAF